MHYSDLRISKARHSSNVKMSAGSPFYDNPPLAVEREDFRRVNENDLDIDDQERIEFIAPEIRDLFRLPGIRSVAQRTGIFGTQKNRLLIS